MYCTLPRGSIAWVYRVRLISCIEPVADADPSARCMQRERYGASGVFRLESDPERATVEDKVVLRLNITLQS